MKRASTAGVASGLALLLLCAAVSSSAGPPPGQAAPSPGRTFFVSTAGDDSHDGLAPAHEKRSRGPFRTIKRAARAVRSGDTVRIRGGIYVGYAGSWGYTVDGTESKPITVTAYPGEAVIIDGDAHAQPGDPHTPLMQVYGDWYVISNLEFRYGSDTGLSVLGDHCTVTNVTSHHNRGSGIMATGRYDTIERCRVHDNSLINEHGSMSIGWGFGISLCANARDSTIRGCESWNNWGEGLSIASGYDCTIEDCVSYDNFTTNIYICQSVGGLCQRNLSYFTPDNPLQRYVSSQNGIIVGDEQNPPDSAGNRIINNVCMGGDRCLLVGGDEFEGTLIAHNTFVNAFGRLGPSEAACVYFLFGSSKGGRFVNNIILQEGRVPLSHLEAKGISFGPNGWSKKPARGCRGAGDIYGDPRLSMTGPTGPGSLTAEWFRISASSPARDRAVVLAGVDSDIAKRPRGTKPDLGALESSGPARPGRPVERP